MKFWSRSTLGVVVGILNVLAYVIASIVIMKSLVRINNLLPPAKMAQLDPDLIKTDMAFGNAILFPLLVICCIMAILSGLLIKGIVKRRHSLMAPWLVMTTIGFICSSVRFIYDSYISLAVGVAVPDVSTVLMVGSLIIALQFFILYKIYGLYKDIRAKNHEQRLQTVRWGQMGCDNTAAANHFQENGFDRFNGFNVVSAK